MEHPSGGTDMVGLSPEGRGDPSKFLPLKESEPDALEGGRQARGGGGRCFKRSLQHWGPGRGQGAMRHGKTGRDIRVCPHPVGFPEAQLVKNPPATREAWVQPLGWEDPLEKGKPTHSSILAWRIPWNV